ncbi:chromosome segregation ATPase [Moritella marina ATCC 15381]|uniref:Chromosome segregation ATPase n=1 Tax=Moritella marina ATCC 15381 TaxID=1202962 RepID=A0A5J6WGW5_MORMI|nr:hypothetical protein [Moritella marina]QFI37313.1 chromosome segregation ATPase [Moritella marina ATCC 15381]
MRVRLFLVSVAFAGSVYFFISNENELNAERETVVVTSPSHQSKSLVINPSIATTVELQRKEQKEAVVNTEVSEQDSLLQEARGQALMTALTSFWKLCNQRHNCDEMLVQQQLMLTERRYQLLRNFPVNQQEELRLMGESFTSQNATLADKVANVKAIRELVWGIDARLLFEEQAAYYNYRLSLVESNNLLSQAQNAEEFIQAYNAMLEAQSDDLLSFGLDSEEAKYEEAVRLIPTSILNNEAADIKAKLATQYLTPEKQQDIANRANQVEQQQQEVMSYQQGLYELERTLANERLTTKKMLSDEQWQTYTAGQLYRYRLAFFGA